MAPCFEQQTVVQVSVEEAVLQADERPTLGAWSLPKPPKKLPLC